MERPWKHEDWCADHGYEECTCDLEERQARWDRENRQENAAPLPRAIARYRHG